MDTRKTHPFLPLSFFLLSCLPLSCGLLDPPPRTVNYVGFIIDSASAHTIEPTWNFTAKPESVTVFPENVKKYVYDCCRSTLSELDNINNNFEIAVNQPNDRSFRIRYNRTGAVIDYRSTGWNGLSGIMDRPDSLVLSPFSDSAYFVAFKDIDSKYILIYRTAYGSDFSSVVLGCQVFKEGIGLLYEQYHGNPFSKEALLKKIDGATVDVIPIISRIMGMQKKYADSISKDSVLLRVEGCLFDSIVGRKWFNDPQPFFKLKSDISLVLAPDCINEVYLYSPDTVMVLNFKKFDTISISGYSYVGTERFPYVMEW